VALLIAAVPSFAAGACPNNAGTVDRTNFMVSPDGSAHVVLFDPDPVNPKACVVNLGAEGRISVAAIATAGRPYVVSSLGGGRDGTLWILNGPYRGTIAQELLHVDFEGKVLARLPVRPHGLVLTTVSDGSIWLLQAPPAASFKGATSVTRISPPDVLTDPFITLPAGEFMGPMVGALPDGTVLAVGYFDSSRALGGEHIIFRFNAAGQTLSAETSTQLVGEAWDDSGNMWSGGGVVNAVRRCSSAGAPPAAVVAAAGLVRLSVPECAAEALGPATETSEWVSVSSVKPSSASGPLVTPRWVEQLSLTGAPLAVYRAPAAETGGGMEASTAGGYAWIVIHTEPGVILIDRVAPGGVTTRFVVPGGAEVALGRVATVRAGKLRLRLSCVRACSGELVFTISGPHPSRTIKVRRRYSLTRPGTATVVVALPTPVKSRIHRGATIPAQVVETTPSARHFVVALRVA
jgi:hypothetical protein